MGREDLVDRILLPLLAATEGLSAITPLHERSHSGVDLVFLEHGRIDDTWHGLRAVGGDISGGAGNEARVKAVVEGLQLPIDIRRQAFTIGGQRIAIARFILAASGRISDAVRQSVASAMAPVPVVFWDNSDINARIRKSLPELFSVADGTTVAYLKTLSARLNTLDALDQIPGVARRSLSQVYEEPYLRRRFDPSIGGERQPRAPAAVIPGLTVAKAGGNAVVVGDQDEGKTSLLRMLAINAARVILDSQTGGGTAPIPILIQARDILAHESSIIGSIKLEFSRYQVDRLGLMLENELLGGRYFLLIDGFSELLRESDKAASEAAIVAFARKYPKVTIVLTGRPVDFLTPKFFAEFMHYLIQEFDQQQTASLLNRWTSDSKALSDVAKKLVRRVREALQLPGSPISATIGVMLYERERRYITNFAEAVDRYMVIRLGRYAHELGIRQEVEWTRKQDLLSEVSFTMIADEVDELPESAVVQQFDEIFGRLGETPRGQVVLVELLESGVLGRENGKVFFHRTAFKDFFAAHAINQRSDRDAFIESKLFERKWGLPLVFAAGLRRKNTDLLMHLVRKVRDVRTQAVKDLSPDYFYGAYLVGRILSNSELSDERARLAALQLCLEACADSLPDFVETAKGQFGNIGEVAALIGLEHGFFVTVGVPWLQNQFRSLSLLSDLTDDERYIVASTYAHLGYDDAFQVLEQAIGKTQSTRVLVVCKVLLLQLEGERTLSSDDKETALRLIKRVDRRLAKPIRQEEIRKLMKFKSRLIELEVQRVMRLASGREGGS